MKAMSKRVLLPFASMLVLAACTTVPMPGDKEGAVPPQIVAKEDSKVWDNPSAFGPVPANLTEAGQAVCATLDTNDKKFKAIGFHSKAKDINGNAFPNGGYYCVTK